MCQACERRQQRSRWSVVSSPFPWYFETAKVVLAPKHILGEEGYPSVRRPVANEMSLLAHEMYAPTYVRITEHLTSPTGLSFFFLFLFFYSFLLSARASKRGGYLERNSTCASLD
jgi:hypothetical protein